MDRRDTRESPESHGGLVSLLVELSRSSENQLPIERHAAQRMLAEAQIAWPGEFQQQWWKWVIEAGETLGLSLRATDISLSGAVDLAASQAPAATCWSDDDESWVVLSSASGPKVHLVAGFQGGVVRSLKYHKVEKLFAKVNGSLSQRWVVLEKHSTLAADHDQEHLSPRARFWRLLAPEWNDIWVACVLALFVGVLATAVPIAAQQLVRTVTFGTLYQPTFILSVVLLGFLGFMAALQALTYFVAEIVQQRLFARMVADLSYRLPRIRYGVADSRSLPDLINRFFDIVTVQKFVANLFVDGLSVVLTTVVGMALLAFYHPFLLGYDVVLLALMLFVIMIVGRGGTNTAIAESLSKYRAAAWLEDIGRCLTSFKMYGAANLAVDRADQLTADYLHCRRNHFRILIRQILCILGLQALASAVLLGLGGYLVMTEQLTLGQLVAAELVVSNIVGSFAKLIKHIESYYDVMAATDKIGHLIDLPLERQRGLMSLPGGLAADVKVRDLSVPVPHHYHDHHHGSGHDSDSYALASHLVINHLSFYVPAGGSLAVVGPPGCGKTLLLDTLYELYQPANGAVILDGIDITDLRRDVLRRHVALVRDIELLEGTVSKNVHFSRPDVDTASVREALGVTALIEEMQYQPHGIETEISVTGRPLTQSQTCRLMLARALAGRPRLLLIDGLLDRLSDDLIQEVWNRLHQLDWRPTLIIVTGRKQVQELCENTLSLLHPEEHSRGGEHSPGSKGNSGWHERRAPDDFQHRRSL